MAQLRPLTTSDIPAALALATSAGWNQLDFDWACLLELAPERCLAMEEDGGVVASATAIVYGGELAWIGMVLTLPAYRGRGYAHRLLTRLLESLAGVASVKLDATDAGLPVYRQLGFVEEYAVERWKGTLPESPRCEFPFDAALDREAFGADRAALVHMLGAARPGRVASYVGPLVCRSAAEARIRVLGAGVSGPAFWDIAETNQSAAALARELGFAPVRRLCRMRKGEAIAERADLVYGLAGFEFG